MFAAGGIPIAMVHSKSSSSTISENVDVCASLSKPVAEQDGEADVSGDKNLPDGVIKEIFFISFGRFCSNLPNQNGVINLYISFGRFCPNLPNQNGVIKKIFSFYIIW